MHRFALPLVSCVLIFAASTAGAAEEAKPTADVCSLLTSEEIQAVIGEAVKESKGASQAEGGFLISQCRYDFEKATDTIVLRLVQRGSGEDARDPRETWKEAFERDLKKAIAERKKGRPEQVKGLGDEAYWMGGRKSGGLYVLKGNQHFRLMLGGEPNQPQKIEKASRLARSILQRL
jgi:hypothetical protein